MLGRLAEASNGTFLARIDDPDTGPLAVYKPISLERPLWDFPDGSLAARERAAYLVSEAGGWGVVPRTLLRPGPFGEGMVQEWIGGESADTESVVHILRPGSSPAGLIPVLRASDEDGRPALIAHEDGADVQGLAILDAVINNTDRKGAHAFRSAGRLYAIDHGVTFHVEPKLRTVLWGWAGDALPDAEIARLTTLHTLLVGGGEVVDELHTLITRREYAALVDRIEDLITLPCFPVPQEDWPSIPWPPV